MAGIPFTWYWVWMKMPESPFASLHLGLRFEVLEVRFLNRLVAALLTIGFLGFGFRAEEPKADKDGWYNPFGGMSLGDRKAAEDPKAFKVGDGLIVAGQSKLTHLYDNATVSHFDSLLIESRGHIPRWLAVGDRELAPP